MTEKPSVATFEEKLRYFANARAGVYECSASPDEGLVPRYRPKLGRHIVHWYREGQHDRWGYLAREDALIAARAFRDQCCRDLNTYPHTVAEDQTKEEEHRPLTANSKVSPTEGEGR